jgi:Ca-activated chloride channel family protein
MLQQFELAPDARVWIHLVWAAPFVIALCAWAMAQRRRRLEVFGYDPERSGPWLESLRRRRWRRALVLALGLLFLAAAAVQPRSNPERKTYKTQARDLVVLLDVSRSMLAEDIQPNRLERAKLELERLCENLRGDRVSLIAFAGDAVVKCPLTASYSYFKSVLRSTDTKSANQGGTKIGDAVHKALRDVLGLTTRGAGGVGDSTEGSGDPKGATDSDGDPAKPKAGETVLDAERRKDKEMFADILLITDGEDHDSYPIHAARQAALHNLGIYVVGLGDENGSTIPIRNSRGEMELLKSRTGEVVNSKLDSKTLQEMVSAAPRGFYWPVGTGHFNLADFYQKTIGQESGRGVDEEHVTWTEIFQPFLFAGLVLYSAYLFLAERPSRGRLESKELAEAARAQAEKEASP